MALAGKQADTGRHAACTQDGKDSLVTVSCRLDRIKELLEIVCILHTSPQLIDIAYFEDPLAAATWLVRPHRAGVRCWVC